MTIESMSKLFNKMTEQREELLPKYIEVMTKYHPDKMCSPYELFKKKGGWLGVPELRTDYTEEQWKAEWDEYNADRGEGSHLSNDYDDDFRDPQTGKFYMYFSYEQMWGDDQIPEADFVKKFHNIMCIYDSCKQFLSGNKSDLHRYSDSDKLTFKDEDILITDPCYIIRDDGERDWDRCHCGSNWEALGIHKYVTKDTLYGDWGCTVWNSDTKEEIGQFCADAGLVSIFSLSEVKEYNPDIEKWCEDHTWCATIIRGFTGTASIKVIFDETNYDFEVRCVGEGNINFVSSQTGL